MEQEGLDHDDPFIVIDVMVEVYLRHREEPRLIMTDFKVGKSVFADVNNPLAMFSNICLSSISALLNTKGEHMIVFSDAKYNRYIVMLEEIQGISILSPDGDTIKELLEATEE